MSQGAGQGAQVRVDLYRQDPAAYAADRAVRLRAIRARIDGEWDHPALDVFGEWGAMPGLEISIFNILGDDLGAEHRDRIFEQILREGSRHG